MAVAGEKMEQINYFDVLGIDLKSTTGEIKKAYRKLALKYHPDHNSSKAGRRIFSRITKAYKVLIDPVRKDEYIKGQSLNVTDTPWVMLEKYWEIICDIGFQNER